MRRFVRQNRPTEKPETALVRAVLRTLHALGIPAWRTNSGFFMLHDPRGGKPRPFRAGIKGQADITARVPPYGRAMEIECKVGRRDVTDEQATFLRDMLDVGVVAIVVRDDVSDLVEIIQRLRANPLATIGELVTQEATS